MCLMLCVSWGKCKLWNHLKVVMWILDILFYFLGFVIKIEKPSIKNSMNSTLSFISNFGVVMLLNFDMVLMSRFHFLTMLSCSYVLHSSFL